METGRDLFNRFLRGEPQSRPTFAPVIRGILSRVEGVSWETLTNDPTLWANSLVKTNKLFRFDGVVVKLDFSLMAEACGCAITWEEDRPVVSSPPAGLCEDPEETGRMKWALEAARRVFEVSRQNLACIGAITGPFSLANIIFGPEEGPNRVDEVKQRVVQVAEAFCKTGPDALMFLEGTALTSAEPAFRHRKTYNTIKNIAGYYNIHAGLYLQGYDPATVKDFASLKMDMYVLGPSRDNTLPPVSDLWDMGEGALGLGLGLPLDDLERAREIIREGVALYKAKGGRGFFFTSLGPLTRDANLETIHDLVNEIFEL
jgi:hypothetical protein